MPDWGEIVKSLGAVAGLWSAIILVRDRIYKQYPVAIFEARPLLKHSQNIAHFLWIKNYSDRPIIISWPHVSDQLGLAKDDSFESIMHSVKPGETTITLGRNEATYLRVIKLNDFDDIAPENSLELRLKWRFAQPIRWTGDRLLRVWIRKRDFDAMVENYVTPNEKNEVEST